MTPPFVYLSEAQTEASLTMDDAITAVRAAFAEHGAGSAALSTPSAMFLPGDVETETLFKVKGGYLAEAGVCGFRIVGDVGPHGVNGEQHHCLMLDPRTGAPLALVAQKYIHYLRTAASGLIAARALTASESPTVAIVGAGNIGTQMARGFRTVFPSGKLIVASRRPETAAALADATSRAGVPCAASASVDAAVRASDTVIAITTSERPVFSPDLFREGLTIVGMGEHEELDVGLLQGADGFFTDDIAFATTLGSGAAWVRSGATTAEAMRQRETASVGAVVAGRHPGRASATERILAIVQGMVIGDLSLAHLCFARARNALP